MNSFTIPKPTLIPGDKIGVSNTLHWQDNSYHIEYKFSQGPITTGLEPWLVLTLLPAMVCCLDLQIEEPVSKQLLQNIGKIQSIFNQWDAKYQKIGIKDAGYSQLSGKVQVRPVASFFSTGVDSFYTLFKNYDEINTLLYMQNPFISAADDAAVTGRIRKACKLLDKPLIEIMPLVRDLTEPLVSWYYSHGAVMASCALLLAPQFSKVLIAGTHNYASLVPWGTHPLLDSLWGTEELELETDGTDATRLQKVEFISQFDIALNNLQVCVWDLPDSQKFNCGVCAKCLHTMASLRAVGKLNCCPVFAQPLDLEKLAQCDMQSYYSRFIILEILEMVEQHGDDPALAKALAQCLANQKPLPYYQKVQGTDAELLDLRHQVVDLRQQIEHYRNALRFQLAERAYQALSRNKIIHNLGESLAHGLLRVLK